MRPRFNASRTKAPAASTTPVAPTAKRTGWRSSTPRTAARIGDREAYPGDERGAQGRLDPEDALLAAVILGGHRDAAPATRAPPAPRGPTCSIPRPPRRSTCAPPPPSGGRRGSPPSRGHSRSRTRRKMRAPARTREGPLPPVPVARLRLGQTPRPPPVPLEAAQEGPEVGQERDERAAADAGAARVDPRADGRGQTGRPRQPERQDPEPGGPPCAMA